MKEKCQKSNVPTILSPSVSLISLVICLGLSFFGLRGVQAEDREGEVAKYIAEMEKVCKNTDDWEAAGFGCMRAMHTLAKIGKPAIPLLLETFEDKGRDWKLRNLIASQVLGQIKDEKTVEPLIKALKDTTEDEGVRRAAARALGSIGDRRAVDPLMAVSETGPKSVRIHAITALGYLDDERAVDTLLGLLSDRDFEVRIVAVRALECIRDEDAIEPLMQLLKNDENDIVRQITASALSSFRDGRVIGPLTETLRVDKSGYVRASAAEALGRLGTTKLPKDGGIHHAQISSVKSVSCSSAIEPLIEALKDKDELVQVCAAKALSDIGDRRAIGPIKEVLAKTKDPYMREILQKSIKEFDQ